MEVTPQIIVNPETGEESISYDNAVVIDNSYRNEVQRQHRELELQAYYEDEDGIHSRFADELANELTDEQVDESLDVEEEEDDELSFEQFENGIYEQLGGQQNYQAMIEWASDYWNEEDIQLFNATFDSNDYEQMVAAVNYLYKDYTANY